MPPPRPATTADIADLARLMGQVHAWHAATYPNVFKPNPPQGELEALFASLLDDPKAHIFVSGTDRPQGYLFANHIKRPETAYSFARNRLMIEHIGVAPETQRAGHGRALIKAARGVALRLKCDELALETWVDNTAAHAFFVAMGLAPRRMWFGADMPQ